MQQALAERRRVVGLEQRRLADLAGMRNDVLCRIERGQRHASDEQLRRLDAVLKVYEQALEAACSIAA